ncbi:hypothetical protein [Mycobacterium gastri]|uniref:ATP-grasp domain-containing protein n=1 Tax=Mycobacterium gastri TaxID=1777 RepID=A0A1X1V9Z6_MYCGS|nr:hypothetical protein [Mycobacterium gastri]ETW23628.1 glutathione synthase/ribosomal protein S6 modification enzyme [Mycobacterium gastri 'Wayne']ORV65875.1 hypothetical protein AWC07_12520 [Mycobacterium gastri]
MKLARPDIFHPRVVLAGWPRQPAGDGDDVGLAAALRHRGLHAHWLPWDHPDVARAHLVILRATRDYAGRLDEFLPWTNSVANLLNPPSVVAWNADRRYLDDLASRGVPTVPGEICTPGQQIRAPHAGRVFVSPTVGTGARRFSDPAAAAAYIAERQQGGHPVLVQTADPAAETVLIFLGGQPSHAFTSQDDALRQGEPDFELWEIGAAALGAAAAASGVGIGELLYARAHLIDRRLLELQLVDPSLGWRRLDATARDRGQRQFAVCVESALERLGLGPFSHRRP